jgi:hypothetical protein
MRIAFAVIPHVMIKIPEYKTSTTNTNLTRGEARRGEHIDTHSSQIAFAHHKTYVNSED